jgi:hypothetical protein
MKRCVMTEHLRGKKKKRVIKPYITRHQNKLHTYFPMLSQHLYGGNLRLSHLRLQLQIYRV